VELISKNFVPVALNTDRLAKDADGAFFRKLMDQWPQGLWIVTPEGKTLAHTYHKPDSNKNYDQNQKKWVDDTDAMLRDGLKAAGELKPRDVKKVNPFPDRGLGFTKEGGVRLSTTVVGLRNGKQDGPPAVDSIVWDDRDLALLTPPDGKTEWTIPESTAKKCCTALTFITDSIYVPRPSEVQSGTLAAKLLRTDDNIAVVELTGTWDAKFDREGDKKYPLRAVATGTGVLEFDMKQKKPVSLLLVLTGTYDQFGRKTPTASVIEWKMETAVEK
jgi:hypothetical protein